MIARSRYGLMRDGRPVERFTLRNAHGIELSAITYGGIIVSLRTPDRHGIFGDVVLGFDTLEEYFADPPYFGAIVGRYANRIAGGRFLLDGAGYQLPLNDGPNHLHGGERGFDKRLWNGAPLETADGSGVRFSRISEDGEEGYPGRLRVDVDYVLTEAGDLRVDYTAETDKPTIINLSQHTYFNLSAGAADDVLDHVLTLHADAYTPVDASLIPTGELVPVRGSPFDFTAATRIGERIDVRSTTAGEQLRYGRGYDHNWVLRRSAAGLAPAARLVDPQSGRAVDVFTTEPGVQFYSGNMLDGQITGKGGRRYRRRAGMCLETQHFPDGPNHPDFPSTVLRPGGVYRSTTVFGFSVTK